MVTPGSMTQASGTPSPTTSALCSKVRCRARWGRLASSPTGATATVVEVIAAKRTHSRSWPSTSSIAGVLESPQGEEVVPVRVHRLDRVALVADGLREQAPERQTLRSLVLWRQPGAGASRCRPPRRRHGARSAPGCSGLRCAGSTPWRDRSVIRGCRSPGPDPRRACPRNTAPSHRDTGRERTTPGPSGSPSAWPRRSSAEETSAPSRIHERGTSEPLARWPRRRGLRGCRPGWP